MRRLGAVWLYHGLMVKWVGYIDPTWEPLYEVQHSDDAYERFMQLFGTKPGVGEPGSAPIGRKLK